MAILMAVLLAIFGCAQVAFATDTTEQVEETTMTIAELQSAAEAGDAEAQYQLGMDYLSGYDVEQDYALAAVWYEKAAEQGHMNAQTELGTLYFRGLGVQFDADKAV